MKNNSTRAINYMSYGYYDSTWTCNGDCPDLYDELILPQQELTYSNGTSCWEDYYALSNFDYHFIFDHDTVKAIGWEAISGTNRGLLKIVRVDSGYLENNNYIITYP